jgi:hypothetical protein
LVQVQNDRSNRARDGTVTAGTPVWLSRANGKHECMALLAWKPPSAGHVSSRKPADLPASCREVSCREFVRVFGGA